MRSANYSSVRADSDNRFDLFKIEQLYKLEFFKLLETEEDIYWTTCTKEIKLPIKLSPSLIKIAKIVRPVKNAAKIRINKSEQSISDDLKEIFEIDINKDAKRPYGFSRTLELFFDKFFEYAYLRDPLDDTEINFLVKEWNTVWLFNNSS